MAKFQHRLLFILLSAWRAASMYCPEGWVTFGSKCYKHVTTVANFDDAQSACNSEEGYIAEIYSAEVNEFLAGLSVSNDAYGTWIGLTDRDVEDDFIWASSGNPAGYTNWKDGEPNDATVEIYDEDCVRMISSSKWVDVRCSVPHYYFLSCQEGWTLFGSKCYIHKTTPVTFDDAQSACGSENGTVAEIYSSEENKFLSDLSVQDDYSTWIGLTDRDVENEFIWASSGNPASYTKWKPGEPNDATVTRYDEDCVRMVSSSKWVDVRCSVPHYYFCEKFILDA